MHYRCVCSDCGKEFGVDEDDEVCVPDHCPACGGVIEKISHTLTSTNYVAWVKKEK